MYSYEDRMKAIELYIKYDYSATAAARELGYPHSAMLARWYKEYKRTGQLKLKYDKKDAYTTEQMKFAVEYYLEHGRNISRTTRFQVLLKCPSNGFFNALKGSLSVRIIVIESETVYSI